MKIRKPVFILFASLFVFVSCQSLGGKNKIKPVGVSDKDDCMLSKITYNYDAVSFSWAIESNRQNQVLSTLKSTNNELERKVNLAYDEIGNLSSGEVFVDDTLTGKVNFLWSNDSLVIDPELKREGYWNYTNNLQYLLNSNKEVVKIEDYLEDSLGNISHYGSGYVAEWNEGLMTNLKNYTIVSDSMGDNVKTEEYMKEDALILNSRAFIYHDRIFYDDTEIELFYEKSYVYDDKKNPIRNLSLASAILPSDFNASIHNPTQIVARYAEGEKITYSISYEYNAKDYPTKAVVKVLFESDAEESQNGQYEMLFEYKNCK